MSGKESVETILQVIGEGGGYTILGHRSEDGAWRIRVSARDWTPALIGDDPLERETEWVHTLQDALARINPGWYRLHPRIVHTEFRTAVLTEVARRVLEHRAAEGGELDRGTERTFARWQRLCGLDPEPV